MTFLKAQGIRGLAGRNGRRYTEEEPKKVVPPPGSGLGFPNSSTERQIPRALYAAAVCSGNKPDFSSTIIRVKSPVSSQAAMSNTNPVACT